MPVTGYGAERESSCIGKTLFDKMVHETRKMRMKMKNHHLNCIRIWISLIKSECVCAVHNGRNALLLTVCHRYFSAISVYVECNRLPVMYSSCYYSIAHTSVYTFETNIAYPCRIFCYLCNAICKFCVVVCFRWWIMRSRESEWAGESERLNAIWLVGLAPSGCKQRLRQHHRQRRVQLAGKCNRAWQLNIWQKLSRWADGCVCVCVRVRRCERLQSNHKTALICAPPYTTCNK